MYINAIFSHYYLRYYSIGWAVRFLYAVSPDSRLIYSNTLHFQLHKGDFLKYSLFTHTVHASSSSCSSVIYNSAPILKNIQSSHTDTSCLYRHLGLWLQYTLAFDKIDDPVNVTRHRYLRWFPPSQQTTMLSCVPLKRTSNMLLKVLLFIPSLLHSILGISNLAILIYRYFRLYNVFQRVQ